MFFSFTEDILDFGRQLGKNIIIGRRVVMAALTLIRQRDVDQRHQRYRMVTLAPLICLSIGIVALGDELGCVTVVLLIVALDNDFDFLIVNMQSDM